MAPKKVKRKRMQRDLTYDPKSRQAMKRKKYEHVIRYGIIFQYLGTNYHGLQLSDASPTVEYTLIKSVVDAGYLPVPKEITYNHVETNKQFNIVRCCRTDKGVHAAANILSLTLRSDDSKIVLDKDVLNEKLPEDMKILQVFPMHYDFRGRGDVTKRDYLYLLPVSALIYESEKIENVLFRRGKKYVPDESKSWMERFNVIAKEFLGSHNHFNFCREKKLKFKDSSAIRTIHSFEAIEEITIDGEIYLRIRICGRSFMYNQIRLMIGTIIWILRGLGKVSTVSRLFESEQKLKVPLAPAEGLALEKVYFELWNREHPHDPINCNPNEEWIKNSLLPTMAKETIQPFKEFCHEIEYDRRTYCKPFKLL